MRFERTGTNVAALVAALALACSKQPEAAVEDGGSPGDAVTVPSVEEARRQAAEDIDESNADAELERLKRELEADG